MIFNDLFDRILESEKSVKSGKFRKSLELDFLNYRVCTPKKSSFCGRVHLVSQEQKRHFGITFQNQK